MLAMIRNPGGANGSLLQLNHPAGAVQANIIGCILQG